MMHYFPGMTEHAILWETSYTNLNMYLATIPTIETEENKDQGAKPTNKEDRELADLAAFFKTT